MGILTSGLAYWQYMRIVKHVTPVAALSSTFMITGFGVLWAVLFLGEPLHSHLLAGLALVTLGIVFGVRAAAPAALTPTPAR